jgi:hypothetical protein
MRPEIGGLDSYGVAPRLQRRDAWRERFTSGMREVPPSDKVSSPFSVPYGRPYHVGMPTQDVER